MLVIKEHMTTTIAIVNLGIGCKEVGQPSKGVAKDSDSETRVILPFLLLIPASLRIVGLAL